MAVTSIFFPAQMVYDNKIVLKLNEKNTPEKRRIRKQKTEKKTGKIVNNKIK